MTQVFEFIEDLKYYWIDGYGYSLTYEQACPTLIDVFSFFEYLSFFNSLFVFFTNDFILLLMIF